MNVLCQLIIDVLCFKDAHVTLKSHDRQRKNRQQENYLLLLLFEKKAALTVLRSYPFYQVINYSTDLCKYLQFWNLENWQI